jgi:predicted RNase H-like HicB family nuclease
MEYKVIEQSMAAKSQGIMTLSLPCRIRKEGKHFVSWCYPLDVYSQGETQGKALRNLEEAVGLFITSCIRRGTLDRVLKDCGIVLSSKGTRPIPKRRREHEITVPLPFVIDEQLVRCQS